MRRHKGPHHCGPLRILHPVGLPTVVLDACPAAWPNPPRPPPRPAYSRGAPSGACRPRQSAHPDHRRCERHPPGAKRSAVSMPLGSRAVGSGTGLVAGTCGPHRRARGGQARNLPRIRGGLVCLPEGQDRGCHPGAYHRGSCASAASRRHQQLPREADHPRLGWGLGTKSTPGPYPVSSSSADATPDCATAASDLSIEGACGSLPW
jgi:hypothetical protein